MITTRQEREAMARALNKAAPPVSAEIDAGWLRDLLADFAGLEAEVKRAQRVEAEWLDLSRRIMAACGKVQTKGENDDTDQ